MEEKLQKRFTSSERMIQLLIVALVRGPISIKKAAEIIAENTGEDPNSVRVLLHRGIEKLFEFKLLRKTSPKTIDITPFGAFYLVFNSPSPLFNAVVLESLERRYPRLLEGITELYLILADIDHYRKSENLMIWEDHFSSIKAEKHKGKVVYISLPELKNLLNNPGAFGNPRTFGRVDFSSVKTLLASLTLQARRLLFWEIDSFDSFEPLITWCFDLNDDDCIMEHNEMTEFILRDKPPDDWWNHYVIELAIKTRDKLEKAGMHFDLFNSMLDTASLIAVADYTLSQDQVFGVNTELIKSFLNKGLILQAILMEDVKGAFWELLDILERVHLYSELTDSLLADPEFLSNLEKICKIRIEEELEKAKEIVKKLKNHGK
ncbi:MAG: hypothetical protein QXP68_07250 [Thermosphaera sp.]